MIIPIKLEESRPVVHQPMDEIRIVPITVSTLPHDRRNKEARKTMGFSLGEVLVPALSKYAYLRDSKLKDFESVLAKENPLKLESFKQNEDNYELQVNVKKFRPEELSVKITDNWIKILGEHEERTDRNNYSKQQFLRKYSLPDRVKARDIKCELSSDGYLLISAAAIDHGVKIEEIPNSRAGSVKAI